MFLLCALILFIGDKVDHDWSFCQIHKILRELGTDLNADFWHLSA